MLNVLQAMNRTLDFHVHDNSDELFSCIEGEFDIEFEDGLTHLYEGDFIIIPKGTKVYTGLTRTNHTDTMPLPLRMLVPLIYFMRKKERDANA